tara:strand:+ start:433 stop:552 length:120 start_codon:yes stop_codon:yes gene_type:complete
MPAPIQVLDRQRRGTGKKKEKREKRMRKIFSKKKTTNSN